MKTRWIVLIAVGAVALLFVLPVVAFLTLPLILSAVPPARPTVWAIVSTDPAMFSIEMPAKAKRHLLTWNGPGGKAPLTTYESHDDVATYSAEFMPFPSNLGSPQEVLDTLLDSLATQLKGRVVDRRTLSLGEYVGRGQTVEFTLGVKDDEDRPVVGLEVWRLYCVRDTVVMLSVSLLKKDKDDPAVDARIARFFDSLKLDQRFPP